MKEIKAGKVAAESCPWQHVVYAHTMTTDIHRQRNDDDNRYCQILIVG